jgi:hypothetical protein
MMRFRGVVNPDPVGSGFLLDPALDPDQALFRILKGTVSLATAITAAPQHL